MMNLPKAWVARLAECHKKQKAGYNQDASPTSNSCEVFQIAQKQRDLQRIQEKSFGYTTVFFWLRCFYSVLLVALGVALFYPHIFIQR